MNPRAIVILGLGLLVTCGCVAPRETVLTLAREPVAEANGQPGKAQVRAVHGQAWYANDGKPQPLLTGMVLTPGAALRTGVNSNVKLYLGINGPVLRLLPGSELGLTSLQYTDLGPDASIDTRLNLRAGRLSGSVRKLASASTYEVTTPKHRFVIRGTDYVADASGDLAILKGWADLFPGNENHKGVSVGTSEIFESAVGKTRSLTKTEWVDLEEEGCFRLWDDWTHLVPPELIYGEWPGRKFN